MGEGVYCRAQDQPGRLMDSRLSGLKKIFGESVDFDFADGQNTTHPAGSTPSIEITQPKEIQQLMNKAELVESVQKSLGKTASKAEAERAVAAVIDGIKGGLKKGKPVQLVGFGTFKIASRKARMGINPKTGVKIKIKASKSVKFAAGKDLKTKLK